MIEITPHDGHALDATVEVAISDGTTARREARVAPRRLIFRGRKQAMAVFERRVAAKEMERRLAVTIFAAPEQNAPLGVRTVLNDLTPP